MSQQLPLGMRLRDDASLENYLPGANALVLATLERFLANPVEWQLYLWGARDSGKTHLLQAMCRRAEAMGEMALYLSLLDLVSYPPSLCDGLEMYRLLCLDDVQSIAGHPDWEHALFHLYNRVRDRGGKLLMSGDLPPDQLGLQLPDLSSRLAWGAVMGLQGLSDDDKQLALQQRAYQRGLVMSAEVASYLLRRCSRDMTALLALLDRLDQASLAAKRPLTVPFVRVILAQAPENGG